MNRSQTVHPSPSPFIRMTNEGKLQQLVLGTKVLNVKSLDFLPIESSVASWQNLIPSFPWIALGRRAGGTIQGKEGIKFFSAG